jgi:hypothetical protein
MRHEESDAQRQVVDWCDVIAMVPQYADVGARAAFANGGKRGIREAVRLKAEGVRKGMPDLFWPKPRNGKHGFFVEMKRTLGGRLSKEQKEVIAELIADGYEVAVCNGFAEAITAIADYFGVRMVR